MKPNKRGPRIRLWWKLAAMAALGVIAMHAAHLTIGLHIASTTITREQAQLGRSIARLVADRAADSVLVDDDVTLDAIASSAVRADQGGVAYCFILRDGQVAASSFEGAPPPTLVAARTAGDHAPIVLVRDGVRVLDVSEPILDGVGEVRVGLDMSHAKEMRERLILDVGLLALAVIAAGIVAALAMSRSIARPVRDMLVAVDRFDPGAEDVPLVTPRGSDEIAVLSNRFNQMLLRLRASFVEQQRGRQRAVETERMVALGSLVAGVTHEVNNPLAGLKNCVHRLRRADLTEAKREEYLGLMEVGLGRIENVVQALLDFARPHPLELEVTHTTDLARAAIRLVEPQLARRRIRCRVEDEGRGGAVLADRHRVGQALVNLLLNAAYATADGGEIRVRLRYRAKTYAIAVEDDGPGIPPELRGRILDPFFTTKPVGEGTGLGLSVTKTIVDVHGGELAFEFPKAGGTIVTIWLAAAPDRPAAAEGP